MFIGALRGIFIFLLASILLACLPKTTGLDQQISMNILWSPFQSDYCGILFWRPISLLFLWCSSNHSGTANGWCATRAGNGILFCVTTDGPSMFLLMVPVFGLEFTLAKLIFAIIIAISAGLSLHYFRIIL